jgi:DNA-binding MarR family transcriptional regulator
MPDLVGHDRHPAAYLVFLYLWRHSSGRPPAVSQSLVEISEGTGLSKRAVQGALKKLVVRKLIDVQRDSITAVATYRLLRHWLRR